MDISQLFIHLAIKRNVGCFHFLAIVNKAVINIHIQVFLWIDISMHFGKYQNAVA